jgi:hypothetical protein
MDMLLLRVDLTSIGREHRGAGRGERDDMSVGCYAGQGPQSGVHHLTFAALTALRVKKEFRIGA